MEIPLFPFQQYAKKKNRRIDKQYIVLLLGDFMYNILVLQSVIWYQTAVNTTVTKRCF